ncbi:MAG: type IV secretion system ATPase VirD4 [Pseudomonadota bacterium]
MNNAYGKLTTILFASLMSLPVGYFVANLYVLFFDGFDSSKFDDFSLLAIFYVSPLLTGELKDEFIGGLNMMAGASLVAFLLLLIILFRPQPKHHGTARWGKFQEMAKLGFIKNYKNIDGPIFGKTSGPKSFGKYLSNGGQPHALVVAPTRAGKGVGVVIPTLLTFDGSVLALDVKGELFEETSRSRKARGDRIIKFSPLDREGRTHNYNPVLDIVATPPERRFMETRRLATNLIVARGKGAEGFIDGARDLFVAGILHCIERGTPTIGAVYDLFALPGEKYKLFAALAKDSKIPEVIRIFDNMAGNDTKIITSYTSVLGDGGLNLWADQLIKNATTTSDFSIYDLRRDPTSVFIVVSPNDLEVVAPLVRLFFQQIVSILQRDMPGKDEPFEVLFLLDEFKHLGKLEAIETAITTIAGYGGRFMFIIQSLAALTANYEQSGKENFLGNTGIQVFMATADEETPQYISKAIGEYTFKSRTKSWQRRELFDTNIQQSEQGAALIRPEQMRLMDDDTQVVLIKGHPPLKMPKVKFYADRILSKLHSNQTGPLPEPESKSTVQAAQSEPFENAVEEDSPTSTEPAESPSLKEPDVGESIEGVIENNHTDEEIAAFLGLDPDVPLEVSIAEDTTKIEQEQQLRQLDRLSEEVAADAGSPELNEPDNAPLLEAQRKLLDRIKNLQEQLVVKRGDSRSLASIDM